MQCPNCKNEVQNDLDKCPYCGNMINSNEYQRQLEEYNRQMEEYNRRMEEYNRQMESYHQQINSLQSQNHAGAYNGQPQNHAGAYNGQLQNHAGAYNGQLQNHAGVYNRQYAQQANASIKKKSNLLLILMISITVVIVIAAIALIIIFKDKDDENNGNTAGTKNSSEYITSSEVSTDDVVIEPATNEYKDDNADYTVMIYMIGSNLESGDSYDKYGYYFNDGGAATLDLDQMVRADIGDNVNVILETGGTDYWVNEYGMEGNHVQRFELSDKKYVEKEDLGDICMCHENVLEDFLMWGKENYPANKYIMIYWDHGCGLTTASFGSDTSKDEGDVLQISDMAEAMKNSGIYFDLTIFNACLMGSLEMASAISPYSGHMIASEEVIYTFGYYYTDWLTEISENPDISVYDLGTIIIDDFEKQYDMYNKYYSDSYDDSNVSNYYTYELALIDTSEAAEVVEELSDMLENANEELYDYKLTDFLTARSRCGEFSGTYSADIIEFCENYKVEGYDDVIDSVKESVLYIKSNISYANGLSFYCPEGTSEGCYAYSYDGRINLMGMKYDESCIKFYDDVLSAYAGYACSDDIDRLGMTSYFNQELVAAYDDTYVKYADNSDYNLEYTYQDGRYILDLGDSIDYVDFMEQRVGYDYTENTAVVLGSDFNVINWNKDGIVDVTFPDKWLCIDGQIVCYVVTDHVAYDDGTAAMTGVVPFIFENDKNRLYGLIINWDSKEGVSVKGYTEIDAQTLTFVDSYSYSMYEGMEIRFCYGMVEHEGNKLKEETTMFTYLGEVHKYDGYGFSIEYADIDEFRPLLGQYKNTAKGYSYMKVSDIFGTEYTTDLVPEE